MAFHRILLCCGVAASGLLSLGALPARAQTVAASSFNAYNSAFLVQKNGQTYYATTLTTLGTTPDGEWTGALDILPALDRYEYTHALGDRNLVTSLTNSLAYYNAPGSLYGNWLTDGWNDNLAWMVDVFIRGYQQTGNASYLQQAEAGWNNGWNQGWDTVNGGIWENTLKPSKCGLSNDPFVFEGVDLYLATGNAVYLTRAEQVYAWIRSHLFNATSSNNALGAPGQMNACTNADGSLQSGNRIFDSGTLILAATSLYRITGNTMYYNDAQLAINYVVGRGAIIPYANGEENQQWEYWYTRGLSDFATEAGLWSTYQSYFQNNANAAWNTRNGSSLTWNNWSAATNESNPDPNEMSSAAAVWQHLPPPGVNLSGTYEIQSAASGLALNVYGNSTVAGAPVIQYPFITGQSNALWTFVPTSGGYYQIKSAHTGQVMNVSGASGINGATIVQWPAQSMIPGNDQWLPVQNPNGTYSFYNFNSRQALDVPGGSKSSSVQLDQWFGNSTAAQQFTLTAR